MFWYNLLSLLNSSTVIVGGGSGDSAAEATAQTTSAVAETASSGFGNLFGNSGISLLIVYAAVIGAMWFFMIRPQRKREKQLREMQAELKAGDDVVTSTGFYGRIVSIGEDCFIVEFGTNKTVRVPVNKADIIGKKTPNLNSAAPAE